MKSNKQKFNDILVSISNYTNESLYNAIKELKINDDFRYYYLLAHSIYILKKDIRQAEENISLCIKLLEKQDVHRIYPNDCMRTEDFMAEFVELKESQIYFLAGEIYAVSGNYAESLKCYQKYQYWTEQVNNKELSEKESIIVYSFRRFNEYSLSDLINNEITVCHPSVMNDPFDSIANLWSTESNLNNICTEEQHISSYSKSFQYFRIRSFVANKVTYDTDDNILKKILMWSFYANEHKGFCIKYRLSKHFIRQEKNTDYCNLRMIPVKYDNTFCLEGTQNITTSNSFALKNKVWEYEDEVRLLSYNIKSESKFLGISLSEDESCMSKIEEITFGLLCPEEHKKVIKNIIQNYSNNILLREIYRTDKNIYDLCIRNL